MLQQKQEAWAIKDLGTWLPCLGEALYDKVASLQYPYPLQDSSAFQVPQTPLGIRGVVPEDSTTSR